MDPQGTERRLAAIMFTDIVGYTALMGRDEAAGRRVRERHEAVVRPLVDRYHGEWVEERGDESLSTFVSALEAVSCALAIQSELAGDAELSLRIGIHLGDVTVEGGRVFGDGVNVASRIREIARPGQIFVSEQVHDSIKNQPDLGATSEGQRALKNVARPVSVYSVARTTEPARPVVGSAPEPVRRILPWVVSAAAAVIAIAAGWWLYAASRESAPIRSIAVLPLENLSGDPEQEYFADGMTDALIADLAQIGALRVISRTSVLQYKGTRKTIPEIARELGVGAVVEGTVLRAGDRVRITAQLIDGRSDIHLWADRYDRDLRDVLDVQSDVARAIAREIRLEMTPQEQARLEQRRPTNPRAHEAYLKGRQQMQALSPESLHRAIGYFEDAIRIDPEYAAAHASLGLSYCLLTNPLGAISSADAMPRARAAGLRALELDDRLGAAHAVLATVRYLHEWNWSEAEREFERAIALSPSDPWPRTWHSWLLLTMRRPEEALRESQHAVDLTPLNPTIRVSFGIQLALTGRPERGVEEIEKSIELDPDSLMGHRTLSVVYLGLGRPDDAAGSSIRAAELNGAPPETIAGMRQAYSRAGVEGLARARLEWALELANSKEYFSPAAIAQLYASLGEVDRALEWLEQAYEQRDSNLTILNVGPFARNLHSDPRFVDLVRRIGLPEE